MVCDKVDKTCENECFKGTWHTAQLALSQKKGIG